MVNGNDDSGGGGNGNSHIASAIMSFPTSASGSAMMINGNIPTTNGVVNHLLLNSSFTPHSGAPSLTPTTTVPTPTPNSEPVAVDITPALNATTGRTSTPAPAPGTSTTPTHMSASVPVPISSALEVASGTKVDAITDSSSVFCRLRVRPSHSCPARDTNMATTKHEPQLHYSPNSNDNQQLRRSNRPRRPSVRILQGSDEDDDGMSVFSKSGRRSTSTSTSPSNGGRTPPARGSTSAALVPSSLCTAAAKTGPHNSPLSAGHGRHTFSDDHVNGGGADDDCDDHDEDDDEPVVKRRRRTSGSSLGSRSAASGAAGAGTTNKKPSGNGNERDKKDGAANKKGGEVIEGVQSSFAAPSVNLITVNGGASPITAAAVNENNQRVVHRRSSPRKSSAAAATTTACVSGDAARGDEMKDSSSATAPTVETVVSETKTRKRCKITPRHHHRHNAKPSCSPSRRHYRSSPTRNNNDNSGAPGEKQGNGTISTGRGGIKRRTSASGANAQAQPEMTSAKRPRMSLSPSLPSSPTRKKSREFPIFLNLRVRPPRARDCDAVMTSPPVKKSGQPNVSPLMASPATPASTPSSAPGSRLWPRRRAQKRRRSSSTGESDGESEINVGRIRNGNGEVLGEAKEPSTVLKDEMAKGRKSKGVDNEKVVTVKKQLSSGTTTSTTQRGGGEGGIKGGAAFREDANGDLGDGDEDEDKRPAQVALSFARSRTRRKRLSAATRAASAMAASAIAMHAVTSDDAASSAAAVTAASPGDGAVRNVMAFGDEDGKINNCASAGAADLKKKRNNKDETSNSNSNIIPHDDDDYMFIAPPPLSSSAVQSNPSATATKAGATPPRASNSKRAVPPRRRPRKRGGLPSAPAATVTPREDVCVDGKTVSVRGKAGGSDNAIGNGSATSKTKKKHESTNSNANDNSSFINDFSSTSNKKQQQQQPRHRRVAARSSSYTSTADLANDQQTIYQKGITQNRQRHSGEPTSMLRFDRTHHGAIDDIVNDDDGESGDGDHDNDKKKGKDCEQLSTPSAAAAASDVNVRRGRARTNVLHDSQPPESFSSFEKDDYEDEDDQNERDDFDDITPHSPGDDVGKRVDESTLSLFAHGRQRSALIPSMPPMPSMPSMPPVHVLQRPLPTRLPPPRPPTLPDVVVPDNATTTASAPRVVGAAAAGGREPRSSISQVVDEVTTGNSTHARHDEQEQKESEKQQQEQQQVNLNEDDLQEVVANRTNGADVNSEAATCKESELGRGGGLGRNHDREQHNNSNNTNSNIINQRFGGSSSAMANKSHPQPQDLSINNSSMGDGSDKSIEPRPGTPTQTTGTNNESSVRCLDPSRYKDSIEPNPSSHTFSHTNTLTPAVVYDSIDPDSTATSRRPASNSNPPSLHPVEASPAKQRRHTFSAVDTELPPAEQNDHLNRNSPKRGRSAAVSDVSRSALKRIDVDGNHNSEKQHSTKDGMTSASTGRRHVVVKKSNKGGVASHVIAQQSIVVHGNNSSEMTQKQQQESEKDDAPLPESVDAELVVMDSDEMYPKTLHGSEDTVNADPLHPSIERVARCTTVSLVPDDDEDDEVYVPASDQGLPSTTTASEPASAPASTPGVGVDCRNPHRDAYKYKDSTGQNKSVGIPESRSYEIPQKVQHDLNNGRVEGDGDGDDNNSDTDSDEYDDDFDDYCHRTGPMVVCVPVKRTASSKGARNVSHNGGNNILAECDDDIDGDDEYQLIFELITRLGGEVVNGFHDNIYGTNYNTTAPCCFICWAGVDKDPKDCDDDDDGNVIDNRKMHSRLLAIAVAGRIPVVRPQWVLQSYRCGMWLGFDTFVVSSVMLAYMKPKVFKDVSFIVEESMTSLAQESGNGAAGQTKAQTCATRELFACLQLAGAEVTVVRKGNSEKNGNNSSLRWEDYCNINSDSSTDTGHTGRPIRVGESRKRWKRYKRKPGQQTKRQRTNRIPVDDTHKTSALAKLNDQNKHKNQHTNSNNSNKSLLHKGMRKQSRGGQDTDENESPNQELTVKLVTASSSPAMGEGPWAKGACKEWNVGMQWKWQWYDKPDNEPHLADDKTKPPPRTIHANVAWAWESIRLDSMIGMFKTEKR